MGLAHRLPPSEQKRETVLGMLPVLTSPVLLNLPSFMLQGVGPVTATSACPPAASACHPRYAERVLAVIDVLQALAPLLVLVTIAATLALTALARRSFPVSLIGMALAATAAFAHIELAMVNAER
ncbi:hypothetical protein [Agrococcus sp. HG114]|uniref:hypothetical protein n=1 Tax=Agrococcus sp. HG114 TaxID=2969757 RepID=UPI00215A41D3|nr:hypothetical protein [Agrococcus sp. HG114]MCR8670022.1 hypothetical protein [Agrococcus sp. HG114]